MLPLILRGLQDLGWRDEIRNTDDVKRFLKAKFLLSTITNHDTGEVVEYIKDTHELTVKEFTDFVEDIAKWCAEYLGFALPAPGSQGEFEYFK